MDTINKMYENLRNCYDCKKKESCVGCPYNGTKLDILQHLKNEIDKKENKH